MSDRSYLSLAALLTIASPANSAELLKSFFVDINGGKACYARAYDAAHLASHPRQRVRRIELDFDLKNPDDKPNTSPEHFELGFGVQLRTSPGWYTGNAICNEKPGVIACYLEADGGEFTLRPSGKSLRLDATKYGLHLEGAKDFMEIAGSTSDDNTFILPPARRAQCDASTANVR